MKEQQIKWLEIKNSDDICQFMEQMCYFHDSCIKELKYVSGAYVNDELSMYPINNARTLKIVIQRQYDNPSMIELQFEDLKFMKLFPAGIEYTCEMQGATLLIMDNYIYWGDSDELSEKNFKDYDGTLICAKRLRWRAIDGCRGETEFYRCLN